MTGDKHSTAQRSRAAPGPRSHRVPKRCWSEQVPTPGTSVKPHSRSLPGRLRLLPQPCPRSSHCGRCVPNIAHPIAATHAPVCEGSPAHPVNPHHTGTLYHPLSRTKPARQPHILRKQRLHTLCPWAELPGRQHTAEYRCWLTVYSPADEDSRVISLPDSCPSLWLPR